MDTEYCISCAGELGEITPLEAHVLYGASPAYQAIRYLVDNNLDMPARTMENTARAFLNTASREECYYWAIRSLEHMEHGLRLIGERAEGMLRTKILRDLGVQAEPLGQFYLAHFPEVVEAMQENKLTDGREVTEQWARKVLNTQFISFRRRLQADLELAEEALVWYQQDDGATYRQMVAAYQPPNTGCRSVEVPRANMLRAERDLTVDDLTKKVITLRKRKLAQQQGYLRRKARAAIKKATKLFTRLGQADRLQLFVSGQDVEIAHPDSPFKFVLRSLNEDNWLEQRSLKGYSHTPYDLSLMTKDNVHIARLCVYFDQTPVLDQLLALTMFVEAGDELDILKKANWFGFSDVVQTRTLIKEIAPELENKLPKLKARVDDEDTDRDQQLGANGIQLPNGQVVSLRDIAFSKQQRREEEFWEVYQGRVQAWIHTWFEPIRDQLATLPANNPVLALAA